MRLHPAFLALPLLLAACQSIPPAKSDISLDERLRNPLFAERYWDDTADAMANLVINKDPIIKDDTKAAIADRARKSAVELSQLAENKRHEGLFGGFVPVGEVTDGYALLLEKTVYLSTTFQTMPGPSLALILSPSVDPRDAEFPGEQDLNLGLLQSPYGAQTYALPEDVQDPGFRTVVLYDTKLGRIYSFAQLAR